MFINERKVSSILRYGIHKKLNIFVCAREVQQA